MPNYAIGHPVLYERRRVIKAPRYEEGFPMLFPELPASKDNIFSTSEDWWDSACLSLGHDRWSLYAIGYKEAADVLVEHTEVNKQKQDFLVYPILFLYRQYLELAIKDLITQANGLLNQSDKFPPHHKISELWQICDSLLERLSPGNATAHRQEVSRLLLEFSEVDPLSMAFRYPEDKFGNVSLSGLTHININNVKDVIAKIAIILDGADILCEELRCFKSQV